MNRLQLSHKLLGLCGLAMVVLALMTYVSYRSLEASDGTARMVVANAAQRAQMDADMMHDAIRADVLIIQGSAGGEHKEAVQKGVAAVAEHGARIRENFRKVAESQSPELLKVLEQMQPAVTSYLQEADAFARAAETATAPIPVPDTFERAFSTLEGDMEKLGDTIDAWTHRINEEATAAKASANRENLWVSVSCGTALFILSVLLVRSIRAPLHAMARVARQVAEGDSDQTISYSSADEVGELADALRAMIEYIGETARAAEALAQGDLSVAVRARSSHDTLSHSFVNMKGSLERLIRESSTLIVAARRGELSTRANQDGLHGAFQEMVGGMNTLLEAVNAPLQEAKAVLTRVEGRDLTARMSGNYDGDFAAIKNSLNSAVQTLEQAIGEVLSNADQVATAAAQITSGSANLAESASTQVATIEQITAALEETTSMSKQSAANAQESRAQAEGAMATAEQGSKNMASLSAAVDAMKDAADETAKIVRTIDEIAFQTNLLALNAAVEAARAGDAGRGFAVVADEVRTLAMRSAEAARNTTQVIERSLRKAEEGVAMNRDATVAFNAIAGQIKKVVEVMKEIAESSRQQHAAVARVSASVDSVARDAQTSAATADEAASAAEELSKQAELMRETTSQFELELGRSRSVANKPPRPVRRQEPQRPRLVKPAPAPRRREAAEPVRTEAHAAGAGGRELVPFDDDDVNVLNRF
jgi:methyl-accepting chemotaxis protein